MTDYRFNRQATRIVRQLRESHGLKDDGEVILRALALLAAADDVVGHDGIVTIRRPSADNAATIPSHTKQVRVWRDEEKSAAP